MSLSSAQLSSISQTLFIPLYCRAAESRRSDPLIRDPLSVRIVGEIGLPQGLLANFELLYIATVLRIRAIDQLFEETLSAVKPAVVINVGCGLDTRFFRFETGETQWFDLDLPNVMTLRKTVVPAHERVHAVTGSFLEPDWMDEVPVPDKAPVMVIAEGLLSYFPESAIRRFVADLSNRYPEVYLIFDGVSGFQAAISRMNPIYLYSGLDFKWGLGKVRELETWDGPVTLERACHYLQPPVPRLGFYNYLTLLPLFGEGFWAACCRAGNGGNGQKGMP